jgi:hypothetical protein
MENNDETEERKEAKAKAEADNKTRRCKETEMGGNSEAQQREGTDLKKSDTAKRPKKKSVSNEAAENCDSGISDEGDREQRIILTDIMFTDENEARLKKATKDKRNRKQCIILINTILTDIMLTDIIFTDIIFTNIMRTDIIFTDENKARLKKAAKDKRDRKQYIIFTDIVFTDTIFTDVIRANIIFTDAIRANIMLTDAMRIDTMLTDENKARLKKAANDKRD